MFSVDIKKEIFTYENENTLLEINLNIKKNEFVSICGQSGSGKSTILKCICGLNKCDGDIIFDKKIWQKNKKILPVQKRNIGYLFQDYALFENMNVIENILFVKHDKKFANELLELVHMQNFKYKMPYMLSGGQKQRVALCRAIINKPKLLLLDEPFSSLDLDMKQKLQNDILSLHNKFNFTTIMISHDVEEINKISDSIYVLKNGKLKKLEI